MQHSPWMVAVALALGVSVQQASAQQYDLYTQQAPGSASQVERVSYGEEAAASGAVATHAGGACCETAGCYTPGCAPSCGGFCDHGDPLSLWDELTARLHGECYQPNLTVGGWTQLGYHTSSDGLFNAHPDSIRLHQQWMWFDYRHEFDNGIRLGGRADFIYGYDANFLQSFGDPGPGGNRWDNSWSFGNNMGWALPQLYGEVGIGELSVILGHFISPIGFERAQSPQNFFYSRSFTRAIIEPFTHTGALATWRAGDNLEVLGGWTAGWDTGFSQYSDQFNRGSNFLGGFNARLTDNVSLSYLTTIGDFGFLGDGYQHSIFGIFDVTERLSFVAQTDYLHTDFAGVDLDFFSMNFYSFYEINGCVSVGSRAEWFNINADGGPVDVSGNLYQWTAGVNVRPHSNVVLRPEYRYQWGDTFGGLLLPNDAVVGGSIWAMDLIVTY